MRQLGASLAHAAEQQESLAVGGQAVMEGIMMRNGNHLALAIRKHDGEIVALRRPWMTIFSSKIVQTKWLRGFPILVETMLNGIKALNISAQFAGGPDAEDIKPWQLMITLIVAMALAFGLFVITPHMITLLLAWLSISGGVEGISFHIWDGLIKFVIFLSYIALIGRLPDIRRVFEYHGAEHKTIAAYEQGENPVTPEKASKYSRLHPRCGTTFLLLVLVISIILHTVTVPAALLLWTPQSPVFKHVAVLFFKLLLTIPIGAIAYETIRWAAKNDSGTFGRIIRGPGLLLQLLTTQEPDTSQLEVGLVALKEALGDEARAEIAVPEYTFLEQI